jgi:hypothetical protein
MADKHNTTNEPFFWIKSNRKAENTGQSELDKPNTSDLSIGPQSDSRPSRIQPNVSHDSARAGLQPGWTRATFIIREEYLSKLKDRAYWDRKAIKDVLDNILGVGLAGSATPEPSDQAKKAKK